MLTLEGNQQMTLCSCPRPSSVYFWAIMESLTFLIYLAQRITSSLQILMNQSR